MKKCRKSRKIWVMSRAEKKPNVNTCAEIHFQLKISDFSASTNHKKASFSSNSTFILPILSIFRLHSSNSIFK
eukprot:UN02351